VTRRSERLKDLSALPRKRRMPAPRDRKCAPGMQGALSHAPTGLTRSEHAMLLPARSAGGSLFQITSLLQRSGEEEGYHDYRESPIQSAH
jgi:hypothetical protein